VKRMNEVETCDRVSGIDSSAQFPAQSVRVNLPFYVSFRAVTQGGQYR
jgi:hypothetical protein